MHKAMWWAQQSGCFSQQQQIEFHELVRMLQVPCRAVLSQLCEAAHAVGHAPLRARTERTWRRVQAKAISPQNVVGDKKIDEGSFGSIESASRPPAWRRVRPGAPASERVVG